MRRALTLLILLMLVAGCTGSQRDNDDADGDGLDDTTESAGRVITIATLAGPVSRSITSDPAKVDTDGDGLSDADEYARESDPRDVDTDDDGLLDGDDVRPDDGSTASAWRAAGILEINGTFLGELDGCAQGGPQLRATVASSDLPVPDQLLDGEELRGWEVNERGAARHVTSDPCVPDTDKDGLLDHDEKTRASDPRRADTDGDGVSDSIDGDPAWDLALGFSKLNVTLSGSANATVVRLVFNVGSATGDLVWPGNGTLTLDVPDASNGDDLEASVIVTAEDAQTGRVLALFDDPRGAIVVFDLLGGTVAGTQASGDTLSFEGADGSMTMTWSVVRR